MLSTPQRLRPSVDSQLKVEARTLYSTASVVAVAQLVESQIVILVVVGSSPISHPTMLHQVKAPRGLDCFMNQVFCV